jgi:hypothetical protein
MTDTPSDAQIQSLAAGIPGLEAAFRDAAARAMKPDMPAVLMLGFFQVVVGYARTIRQYRKAAGMPNGWPAELTLLLGSVRACAFQRLVDPALTGPQALRLFRTAYALAQAALQSLPVAEKKGKPEPNPFARAKAPALPRLPAGRNDQSTIANLLPDMAAMLDSAIGAGFHTAAGVKPATNGVAGARP